MNYQIKKLGDLGEYTNGKVFRKSEWGSKGLPIIRIQNLNKENAEFNYCNSKVEDQFHVNNGDILISWSASLDVYVWNRGEALLNQHIFKVILDKVLIDKSYFVYLIKTKLEEMASKTHGATMKHIVRSKFLGIEIPLPPLETQKKIVKILGEKFVKIREAKSLREQSIADTEKILSQTLREIFEEGKEKGWEEKSIKDICEHPQYGFTASSTQDPIGPKMLRITDIQDGKVNWETVPYCECEDVKKYQLKQGDIVFARTGATLGKSFLITDDPKNCIFASYLIRLRTRKIVSSEFLYYFFQSLDYWNQITEQAVGGAQPNVNGTKLANLKILIPPLTEQKKIVERLDALSKKIRQMIELQKSQLKDFKKLEKSYLYEAFNKELI